MCAVGPALGRRADSTASRRRGSFPGSRDFPALCGRWIGGPFTTDRTSPRSPRTATISRITDNRSLVPRNHPVRAVRGAGVTDAEHAADGASAERTVRAVGAADAVPAVRASGCTRATGAAGPARVSRAGRGAAAVGAAKAGRALRTVRIGGRQRAVGWVIGRSGSGGLPSGGRRSGAGGRRRCRPPPPARWRRWPRRRPCWSSRAPPDPSGPARATPPRGGRR